MEHCSGFKQMQLAINGGGDQQAKLYIANRKCTPKKGIRLVVAISCIGCTRSIMYPNKCSFLYNIFRNIHLLGLEPSH